MATKKPTTTKPGLTLHAPILYDLQVWLFTRGRENALRETILKIAHLQPGEAVLDIGCGTGSTAIAAKTKIGRTGRMCGVDASPEMIARARKKATRAGAEIAFEIATVQELPFLDGGFDVVLSTMMFHHLSREARRRCGGEIRRVLKPEGRALVVDFAKVEHAKKSLIDRVHARHGQIRVQDIVAPLEEAGLCCVESGKIGLFDLEFVLAKASQRLPTTVDT